MPGMADDLIHRLNRFARPQNHGYGWLLMLGGLAALIAWGAGEDPDMPAIVPLAAGLVVVWCFGGIVVRSIEQRRGRH